MLTLACSCTRLTCSRALMDAFQVISSRLRRSRSGLDRPRTAGGGGRVPECFSAAVTGSPVGDRAGFRKASGALKITMAIHVKPMATGAILFYVFWGADIRFASSV